MRKLLVIKYAELNTKKGNINYFLKLLKQNINKKLIDYDLEIIYNQARMFIIPKEEDYESVINHLKKIFGIHEIVIGYEIESDIEIIKKSVIDLLISYEFNTFKVETKRSNKDYPLKSPEISKVIGAHILKNISNLKVDVNNPELLVNIEIRNNFAYLYFADIEGAGGLPVGTSGKGLLMLSGGIDSPVAGYLALKRGVSLEAIYFESPPHTSQEAKNKVLKLKEIVEKYGNDIRLHVINLTEIQEAIYKSIPHEYLITILRRMMYRIAERVAKHQKCHIIINGESIGQVASQTLTSMRVVENVTNLPIIRPLACYDKAEIIKLAKKIGTYETSILPYEDCCTIFVPKHPVINPTLSNCLEYEKLIDYSKMIDKCLETREVISKKNNKFTDIL